MTHPAPSMFACSPTHRIISSLLIAAGMLCAAAPTSSWAQDPGWTPNATVTNLVVTASGGINVRLSPDLTGCTSQSGYGPNYASVYPDHPGINRIKADLLAAYVTGKVVSLYLTDTTCKVTEINLGGW